ncbi:MULTISPECIES: hypothetical protein [Cysteiniphilum]|uniref:hypothetical protein n=1 Tax=Cysteiniphilum TaxID=2056696 RepID=UPI001782DD31|nr:MULTISPECIES: hypothetical protein [Cysteiniphilum]
MSADTSNKKHKHFKVIIITFYGFLLLFCAVTYISDKLATGVFASASIDLSKPSEVTLDYFIWFPGRYEIDIRFQKESQESLKLIDGHIPDYSDECNNCQKFKLEWCIYQQLKVVNCGIKTLLNEPSGGKYSRSYISKSVARIILPFGSQRMEVKYLGGLEDLNKLSPEMHLAAGGFKRPVSNLAGLLMWGNVFVMIFIWPFLLLSLIVNNIVWLYKKSKNKNIEKVKEISDE